MKKALICGLLVAFHLSNHQAQAADNVLLPDDSGDFFYGSLYGGASFLSDTTFEDVVTGTSQVIDVDFDTGFAIGGAVGTSLGTHHGLNFRGEIDIQYSSSEIGTLDFSGNAVSPDVISGDSQFKTTNVVANLMVDLDNAVDENIGIFPYFGAGIGAAFADIDVVYGNGVTLQDSSQHLVLQGIIGASVPAFEGIDLFMEGRYSRIFGFEATRTAGGAATGIGSADIDTFNLNGGLRFTLN